MTLKQRQLWTALLSLAGIGPSRFQTIRQWCQRSQLSLEDWWDQAESLTQHGWGLSGSQIAALARFKQTYTPQSYWEYLKQQRLRVILAPDRDYPFLLKQTPDHPEILFVKGKTGFWNQRPVAVVGTRKMSAYGEQATRLIVKGLSSVGSTIISGGMYGVDMTAHQTAVASGGKTVVVMGFGHDHWYPSWERQKATLLEEQGVTFISEFPPFYPPHEGNFPSRNRIVAGMSLGLVVVEAAAESGSLITAERALEYNREVFAVPGPITNPYSQGTKNLINQGATLITSVADIGAELRWWGQASTETSEATNSTLGPPQSAEVTGQGNSELERLLYLEIQARPLTTEDLIYRVKSSAAEVSSSLSLLEIQGLIKRRADQWLIC